MTYLGGITFGATGDEDTSPDVGTLAERIAQSPAEPVALAGRDAAAAVDSAGRPPGRGPHPGAAALPTRTG